MTLQFDFYDSLKFFKVECEMDSIQRIRIMSIELEGFNLDVCDLITMHHDLYVKIKNQMREEAKKYLSLIEPVRETAFPVNEQITGIPTLDYQQASMATKAIDAVIKSSMWIIFFFLFPSFSFCQMHVDFGVGISRLNKSLPTAIDENGKVIASRNLFYNLNISADYQIGNVLLGGDFIPQFGGSVANTPSYAGLKAGYAIANFTPAIGYFRAWVSSDNPELNKYVIGYSLTYYHEMGDPGGVYAKAMYINNSVIANIGCRINIQ